MEAGELHVPIDLDTLLPCNDREPMQRRQSGGHLMRRKAIGARIQYTIVLCSVSRRHAMGGKW
jgi:hypothetical protein